MNSKKIYQTSQKELVLSYLKRSKSKHITAKSLYDELQKDNEKIGLTTVYRHLESLTKEGILLKSIVDENTPACFEYTGHSLKEECYHLKCINCGKLIHLHCDEVNKLEEHIFDEHGFKINPNRIVFFGECEECQK